MTFADRDPLEDLLKHLEESGAFEKLACSHQAMLETDPEWSRQEWTHVHTLMEGWAYGVLSSYQYFNDYQVPEGFDEVFAHIATRLADQFRLRHDKNVEVVKISLCEIRQWFRQWAEEMPQYLAWNDLPGSGVQTRYSPTASGPEFIDLAVPSHNAALFVRNQRRHDAAFEKYFAREYPDREGLE